jgi:hypothetical protein
MHKLLMAATVMAGLCFPAAGWAQTKEGPEKALELPKFGRLLEDRTVKVASKGGKILVLATLKNLADGELKVERVKEGASCSVKKDLLVHQDEDEPASPGNVAVRVWQVAAKDGECPFLTLFEMSKDDFAKAHAVLDKEFPVEKPKQEQQ